MTMDNAEVARILTETADLMEIAGEDGFRIRSYRNAAAAIEGHPERVLDIAADPNGDVTRIPGIGKGLAAALKEVALTGTFERREQMLGKIPPTALEMLKIQGLGPKSVKLLIDQFRVTTLDDLERICLEHRLRELPRMGQKLEEKVLRSIALHRQTAGRFLLDFASDVAAELSALLGGVPGVTAVTPAGSLRRGKETVGDVDLLVTGPNATAALDVFAASPRVKELLAKGANKVSGRIGLEGLQVDVRTLPEENYGAAMQYFTGSKEHNVVLRTRAVRMGLTLNEYGLTRVSDGKVIASRTEEEIYQALGLAWIPPELRENHGEIEAAEAGTLPQLLEPGDMHGDLHMHTTESDGRATLAEMAEAARRLGHRYIAVTDHSKALAMANGLDERRCVAFAQMVRGITPEEFGIRVFSGLECDILKDGRMDLASDALAELDLVVASVHSYMNLDPTEMTDRLLRAMEEPSVRILGHPTGRMLLRRDAYAYRFEAVASEAARKGIYLEVNSSPERLDLHASPIRAAAARGCRFAISTDAHSTGALANLRYGVVTARRGWLTKADVLNALPLPDFEQAIRRRPSGREGY